MIFSKQKTRAWGVSVRGPAHIRNGLPNQDSYLIRHFPWGLIAVVSDGLGSKPLSHKGSEKACQSVLEAYEQYRISSDMDENDFLALIHARWLSLIAPNTAETCSATCLFICMDENSILWGRLGDGVMGCLGAFADDSFILTDAKEEQFSNQTEALRRGHSPSSWQYKRTEKNKCRCLFLCTDGISADLETNQELAFFKNLAEVSRGKSCRRNRNEAVKWLKAWPVQGHSDDKTLVFIEVKNDK